ncbi:MAG TPA: hypothetical protein VLA70_02440 [Nocardioides sp.]|nr:hypothetical protein [Nocardioides sp.]
MSTTSVEPATPTSHVPSRRTVLRAAAWTAPAVSVAVAVPAYAACSPTSAAPASYTLRWGAGTYTRSSAASGSAVVPGSVVGAEPVNVTITSSVSSTKVRRTAQNLAGSAQGLELHHASAITAGREHRQVVTFSFSREVTGLSFTIKDIDSDKDGWWDRVELSGSRQATPRLRNGKDKGPYVVGSGVQGDPWHYYDGDTVLDNAGDTRGQVDVRYTEPVSVIALTYWSSVGGSNQRIWLSDFSFTASSC